MPSQPAVLRGLGVSPGMAGGPLHRMEAPTPLPDAVPEVKDAAAEVQRARQALGSVAAELSRRAERAGETAGEVLHAEAMIATDPSLIEAIEALVAAGRPAPWAVTDAIAEQRTVFESLGGYMAERITDLEDIRDRAVAVLLDLPLPGLPEVGHPFVLAAEDLAPADTALLDPRLVLGLVTSRGGPTSHTAILAKALGLPAVVACAGILEVAEGTPVTVDGSTGEVHTVSVDRATAVHEQAVRTRLLLEKTSGPGRTADGQPIKLLLNVGSAVDL
ncbi:MAG: phosphoenolpyruvate--protein phosphotransferase, partial [Geodermatophilaceae bacterium]|nr:phosphoenolpyruvate--protein phosphotransferase [Geodermatophilaceae bacterium]